jgi:carboxylesterase
MSVDDSSIRFDGGRIGFLLIHGLGGTPLEMRYIARGLWRAGYTVHCPQLAGHCGTYEELRATGWHDWYASCAAALQELRDDCDIVVVGGLSAGAILALNLAADYPDQVDSAVLYAPTLKLDGWGVPWYSRFFRLVTQRWCADLFPFAERHPYGLKDERIRALAIAAINSGDSSKAGQMRNPGSVMLELRWLVQAVCAKLRITKQPTLIIHPREDDRASLGNTAYLLKHLGGLVDAFVLDDSYHVITMDKQRDLVLNRTIAHVAWLTEQGLIRDEDGVDQVLLQHSM